MSVLLLSRPSLLQDPETLPVGTSKNMDDLGHPLSSDALPHTKVRSHLKICVRCELNHRRSERQGGLEGTESEWETEAMAAIEEERRRNNRQEQHVWRGKFYKQATLEMTSPESEFTMTRKKLRHAKTERAHSLLQSFLKAMVKSSFWDALRRAGSRMEKVSTAWTRVEELGDMLRSTSDPTMRQEVQKHYDEALKVFDQAHEQDIFEGPEAGKQYRMPRSYKACARGLRCWEPTDCANLSPIRPKGTHTWGTHSPHLVETSREQRVRGTISPRPPSNGVCILLSGRGWTTRTA